MSVHPYRPPAWASALAGAPHRRVSLAHIPTPIQTWRPPGIPDPFDIHIKRDDLTGSGLSGNKVRKLEFIAADALDQGRRTLLTCGGIQSNHCRATALAACRLGLRSHLFLRTTAPDRAPPLDGNVLLDQIAGARITLLSPDDYQHRDTHLRQAAGDHGYPIPEGGSNPLGSWGYIQATAELLEQLQSAEIPVTDLVVALGSGGTTAGLAAGLHLAGSPIKLHAVNVCDDAPAFHRHINSILRAWEIPEPSESLVDILDGYVGLGYAQSRPEELTLLRDVARSTGILLDPVYTGKAFFGLRHELQANPERFAGPHLLFLHTGGLFGLFPPPSPLPPLL